MSEFSDLKMFRYPWFSFFILILLGQKKFVETSIQRIKTINNLEVQEWEKKIRETNRKEIELTEKKRKDELERQLGWGYSFPYQPPQNTYVVEYKGLRFVRPAAPAGNHE